MADWIKLSKKEREELLALPGLDEKVRKRIERADKPIAVRSAKQKGLGFQKQIGQDIADIIGEEFGMDDDSPISSRPGGQHGVDIILRGEAKRKFPFSIEAKNQESLSLISTVNQASENTLEGTDWIIVHKNKRIKEPLVIIRWRKFLEIWAKLLTKDS